MNGIDLTLNIIIKFQFYNSPHYSLQFEIQNIIRKSCGLTPFTISRIHPMIRLAITETLGRIRGNMPIRDLGIVFLTSKDADFLNLSNGHSLCMEEIRALILLPIPTIFEFFDIGIDEHGSEWLATEDRRNIIILTNPIEFFPKQIKRHNGIPFGGSHPVWRINADEIHALIRNIF
jgi:hypothetical protein